MITSVKMMKKWIVAPVAAILALSNGLPLYAQQVLTNSGSLSSGVAASAGAVIGVTAGSSSLGALSLNSSLGSGITLGGIATLQPATLPETVGNVLQVSPSAHIPTQSLIQIVPAAMPLDQVPAVAMPKPAAAPNTMGMQAPQGAAASENAAKTGVVTGIQKAMDKQESGEQLFDGQDILPSHKAHPLAAVLDEKPTLPGDTGHGVLSWDISRIPQGNRLQSSDPIVLPGDPKTAEGVEHALKKLIQDKPELFQGIKLEQLMAEPTIKVDGKHGLADTIFVHFHQQYYHPKLNQYVKIEGSYLSFVVAIINGHAVVVLSNAQLYPNLPVNTGEVLSDAQMRKKAYEKIGKTPETAGEATNLGPRVMYLGSGAKEKKWRTVQVYSLPKQAVMIAVDVNTGETFAWDSRQQVDTPGTAQGRGIFDGSIENGTPSVLALRHIEVKTSDGKSVFADKDGKFVVPGKEGETVQITARLKGRYADVSDTQGKDLVVTQTVKAGQELKIVFNPEGADENALAQVNGYFHTSLVHDELEAQGIHIAGLDKPMPVKVNIDDECNAYYDGMGLNFFKSSSRCANSSYGDVNYHEYGHAFDDRSGIMIALMTGNLQTISILSILNGGLSEGIGDMLSLLITAGHVGMPQPVLGRGFLKGENPGGIRDGRNKYQYSPDGEVHEVGQAFMGAIYKTFVGLLETRFQNTPALSQDWAQRYVSLFRSTDKNDMENLFAKGTALINELEQDARKAYNSAFAETLDFMKALSWPVVIGKPKDIPQALQMLLLRDVGSDGKAPHEKEIRAAAKAHGIDVQLPTHRAAAATWASFDAR